MLGSNPSDPSCTDQLVIPGRLLPVVVRSRVGVDADGRVVADAAVVEHRRLRDDVDGGGVAALPVLRRRPVHPAWDPRRLVLQRGRTSADGENFSQLLSWARALAYSQPGPGNSL